MNENSGIIGDTASEYGNASGIGEMLSMISNRRHIDIEKSSSETDSAIWTPSG